MEFEEEIIFTELTVVNKTEKKIWKYKINWSSSNCLDPIYPPSYKNQHAQASWESWWPMSQICDGMTQYLNVDKNNKKPYYS